MAKLVIYLAEGGTIDVPLNKERITIGRRPDNDVCLPFPAVSGEHAQVVTILADSFLEDLGSTNGTLVNGKAVAKHFLMDRDLIDIGRQRLTYLMDDDAKVEALPPDISMRQLRGLTERVDGVKAAPKAVVAVGPRSASGRQEPAMADLEQALAVEGGKPSVLPVEAPLVQARATSGVNDTHAVTGPMPVPPTKTAPGPVAVASAPAAAHVEGSKKTAPSVRVLSGASQGRTVAFPGTELTVGRVGVQVAVVRRLEAGGYLLIPLEGRDPPRINGAAVSPEGSPLHPGDTFEVAGVRLELSVHA